MKSDRESQKPGGDDIAAMGYDLGRHLAHLRRGAGLTQHRMARMIGYARGTLSAVECGRFDQARCFWQHRDDVLQASGQKLAAFGYPCLLG